MSTQQYREFARECLRWAEEGASEDDRQHFVEMAKAWMHAAAEIEASHTAPMLATRHAEPTEKR